MTAQIIVALDVPDSSSMRGLLERLPARLEWYKLGLELFCAEGPDALKPLHEMRKNVFLDLKLHDIPRTVAEAVRSASRHGIQMLTLHASGGSAMMAAAASAAAEFGPERPKLLAVTVLTSLDIADLNAQGIGRSPSEQVSVLARLAIDAGMDGLVCSAREVGVLRRELGPEPLLITPGIRMPSKSIDDQKRVASPADAVRDGASHLVVGRPITKADDPAKALRDIEDNMASAH